MLAGDSGALAGLTVVELGESTSGPFAGKLLADFGAEVIKLETPGIGDSSRYDGPFPNDLPDRERSGLFQYLNTNKLSVTVDIDRTEGASIVAALLSRSDIVVTNYSAERLGRCSLSPAELRVRHPNLIIVTVSPFGSNGPRADYRADDLVSAAMGGLVYSTPGMPDCSVDLDCEPPLHPGCAVAQTVAGLVAATAAMVAVLGRTTTGQGCHLDVSEQAAVAAMQQRDVSMFAYSGRRFQRGLNPDVIGRMPNFYLPCRDGYVVIAAFLDHQWTKLVGAMGSPDWATAEEFSDAAGRTANWTQLRGRLTEWTKSLTGDELFELGRKLELPLFPFYSVREMVNADQVAFRRSLVAVPTLPAGTQMPGALIGMTGTPWTIRKPAPQLGEHTRAILQDQLCMSDSDLSRLTSAGVI